MPFLLPLIVGAGVFATVQADDAIETATGERGGIPWVQLAILAGIGFAAYQAVKK
jgi:hypothetical protein